VDHPQVPQNSATRPRPPTRRKPSRISNSRGASEVWMALGRDSTIHAAVPAHVERSPTLDYAMRAGQASRRRRVRINAPGRNTPSDGNPSARQLRRPRQPPARASRRPTRRRSAYAARARVARAPGARPACPHAPAADMWRAHTAPIATPALRVTPWESTATARRDLLDNQSWLANRTAFRSSRRPRHLCP
jgi:hypothetical protein